MAATKLFTYKIRNPKISIESENNHWINLGTCYQDFTLENSSPFFVFNNGAIDETGNSDGSIQQITNSGIATIKGDSDTHTYYNLYV